MNTKKNNLIIFATYWNEADWVEASLAQIEKLNPLEVIICEGCFDLSRKARSTDGTTEIIERVATNKPHWRVIRPERKSKLPGILALMTGHKKTDWYRTFTPARMKSLYLGFRAHHYRINQALTFQKMISLSKEWQPGRWFMTYDADQYYSDEMIVGFTKIVNGQKDLGVLTGREKTFFNDFTQYTDEYEKRIYNNMPHKIYKGTSIIPTRGIVIEDFSWKSYTLKHSIRNEFYVCKRKTLSTGSYYHYKFKFRKARLDDGYSVGGRVKPDIGSYLLKKHKGSHPEIIEKYFLQK